MLDWQKRILKKYNPQLIQMVSGNVLVMAELFSVGLINVSEKKTLQLTLDNRGEIRQATELLDILSEREFTDHEDGRRKKPAFDTFIEVLVKQKQSGAVKLLKQGIKEYEDSLKQQAGNASGEMEYTKLEREYFEELKHPKPLEIPEDLGLDSSIPSELEENAHVIKLKNRRQENVALIINITECPGYINSHDKRQGSQLDVSYMASIWQKLGFIIFNSSTYEKGNWTKYEIQQVVEDFLNHCVQYEPASIVIFIGSHGADGYISTSDGPKNPKSQKRIHLMNEIFHMFYNTEKAKKLSNIPKLFFVNACQVVTESQPDEIKVAGAPVSEMIVCYSQVPTGKSWRCPISGSWFVHCLAFYLIKLAKQMDFESIMNEVRKTLQKREGIVKTTEVGTSTAPEKETGKSQVAWYWSTLNKKIYFRKSN